MTIRIEALEFEAILGILDFERTTPQPVRVDATFTYDYGRGRYLDYARLAESIRLILQREKFHLVEEAIETLFLRLKHDFPQIETARIAICKPEILPDCRVCVEDFRSFL
ncbi:dihydroneopterin aldolase [Hydrogenimonas sp.]